MRKGEDGNKEERSAGEDMGKNKGGAYKPASKNTPDSANFLPLDCCRFQMKGRGRRRIAKSVTIFGMELPRRKAKLSTQRPLGIDLSHQKATGVQEKMETVTWW